MLMAGIISASKPSSEVLIVEDATDLAMMMEYVISAAGFRCDVAASLEEARDKLKTRRYRFLLLDLILPDGCGLNLLGNSEFNTNDHPEVLVTSGNVSEEIRQSGKVSAFFQKPFNINSVIEFMQGQLRGSP